MALFTENYQEEMMHILKDMAHVRISGTKEEADCAIYLQECCKKMGFETRLEAFQVEMCDIHEAVLTVDGKEIPCKGYRCAGSGTVEAPFYYMPNTDACSLAQCKGKIVMLDGGVGYWGYRDLIENGAVGIITYDGNANYADEDIDLRELRSFVREGSDNKKIPCVNINAKSAIKLVNQNAANAKIVLNQDGQTKTILNRSLTHMDFPLSLSGDEVTGFSGSQGELIVYKDSKRVDSYNVTFKKVAD